MRHPLSAGLLALVLVVLLSASYRLGWHIGLVTNPIDSLELRTLDWRFELRGQTTPGSDTVILAFDDKTMQADPTLFERRDGWVRVLEALNAYEVSVVGIDALFIDPERLLPEALIQELDAFMQTDNNCTEPVCKNAVSLLEKVHIETKADQRLVSAIAQLGKVILAYHLGSGDSAIDDPALAKSYYGQSVAGPLQPLYANNVVTSLPEFNAAAKALGVISIHEDATHSVRKMLAVRRHKQAYVTPLAIQLVAAHLGFDKSRLAYIAIGQDAKPQVQVGDLTTSLGMDHGLWLNYRGGSARFPTFSVIDLIEGRLETQDLGNKIVLLGYTYFGHDTIRNPYSNTFPGVEVHATAVDNLLADDFLRRLPWWADTLVCLLFGLAILGLFWPRFGFSEAIRMGGSALLLLAILTIGYFLFAIRDIWTFWIGPLLTFLFVCGACLIQAYFMEGLLRRKLRHAFAHYVSNEVIEELLVKPSSLKLGGERKVLSVLFSDIRGFTSLSEGMPPERLTDFLNSYLTPMTEIVLTNRGLLDKYIGDAIMAVYGAPVALDEHAVAACNTALQMLERLGQLSLIWRERGLPELKIGIGINTGPVSVGNMGSKDRFDYTVVGDNVNLASRLEGLNKHFGTSIIMSEQTKSKIGDIFTHRELDQVTVKGKNKPVRIYELIRQGKRETARDGWIGQFEKTLKLYRDRQFKPAADSFYSISQQQNDPISKLYHQRCLQMMQTPPSQDWDGVFRADRK